MSQAPSIPTSLSHETIPSGAWRMLSHPGRARDLPTGADAAYHRAVGLAQRLIPRQTRYLRRAEMILKMEKEVGSWSSSRLREEIEQMTAIFRRAREGRAEVDRAMAMVRQVSGRELGMFPYREQVAAALAMSEGYLIEMATGEGKTLSASLPAVLAGWRGRGCHVITVNDYLAQRDAQVLGPLYRACGLRVAHVDGPMPPDKRREAYLADVTYATNKEVCADFLRDQLLQQGRADLARQLLVQLSSEVPGRTGQAPTVLRGLAMAIIDEADSVLVDEAVTPLIISGDGPNAEQVEAYAQAAGIAGEFEENRDYKADRRYHEIALTKAGQRRLREVGKKLGGLWRGRRRSEEMIVQALCAREFYVRGRQYVVQEGKVVIVDEFTGRLMPDRTWRAGLHQAVEAKEGLEIQPLKETLARVSFQRFFRLYEVLAGMTGTGWEARSEFWQVYGLSVVKIPTHKPCIRVQERDRVYATEAEKWGAVIGTVRELHAAGRPVLVGTRSVKASEVVSAMLATFDLEHEVLNATRHEQEAQIVAQAGQPGRITVATNMAGRGTDIKLGRGVSEMGGLAVIATERHESGRIDRQLFGRAGRQGDPGSAVAFVSLEDDLLVRYSPGYRRWLGGRVAGRSGRLNRAVLQWIIRGAQRRAERGACAQRKHVLRSDTWLDENLGFAGQG